METIKCHPHTAEEGRKAFTASNIRQRMVINNAIQTLQNNNLLKSEIMRIDVILDKQRGRLFREFVDENGIEAVIKEGLLQ